MTGDMKKTHQPTKTRLVPLKSCKSTGGLGCGESSDDFSPSEERRSSKWVLNAYGEEIESALSSCHHNFVLNLFRGGVEAAIKRINSWCSDYVRRFFVKWLKNVYVM